MAFVDTSTSEPSERNWRFGEGDEIAAGLSALRRLGGGHRYEAYLAFSESMHTIVVVKVVRPHLVGDEHTLAGLREEVRMLERLAHPVLVRSFGAELGGPRPHVILEHIEGPRLSTLIRRHGPLPPEQLAPLASQLCAALHYLGNKGVVHLDIKPANVIMAAPPRLIDFSVALDFDVALRLEHPIGTDGYMAPEQCDPSALGPVGPAADVWGVGVTLYRGATGRRPFPEGDADAVGAGRWPQLEVAPKPPPNRLPAGIAEPIMQCLAFDPTARPAPGDLAERFDAVLAAQPKPKLAPLKPRWR